MDINEQNLEQSRLAELMVILDTKIAKVEKSLRGRRDTIIKDRKEMWDSITHVIRDFDDAAALALFNGEVKQSEDAFYKLYAEKELLQKLLNSPYFGRIDFNEDGTDEREEVYIGIGSFYDPLTFKFYVYDWRAPISSVYYEYDLGGAQYECADGTIKGVVTLKRQYKIVNGAFEYLFDAGATVNDEILARILASNTENKIKVIVNTIQREQNAVIRSMVKGNMLVTGPAGSGKTSVGLHRLAYLLYHKKGSLSSKNILVISNNYVFNNYISGIIPELGENDVLRMVFFDLIKKSLPFRYNKLGLYEQTEYIINTSTDDVRIKSIKLKYSMDFLNYMQEFCETYCFHLCDIYYKDQLLFSKEELENDINIQNANIPFKSRLFRLFNRVERGIDDYFRFNKEEIEKQIYNEIEDILDKSDIAFHYKRLRDETKSKNRKGLMDCACIEPVSLYKRILTDYIREKGFSADIINYTVHKLKLDILLFEDALAVACVKTIMGEMKQVAGVKHVLIDETQDYNNLQHFIIKNMFPNSQYTFLADFNQGIFNGVNIGGEQELHAIYGSLVKMELNKSYRSTRQINELAAHFIDNNPEYFGREGNAPTLTISDNALDAILSIIGKEGLAAKKETTCILTRSKAMAKELNEQLKHHIPLVYVEDSDEDIQHGICIMPIVLAKGLEFDHVVICDYSNINHANGQVKVNSGLIETRIRYLMVTRALHNLYIAAPKEGVWGEYMNLILK